MKVTDTLRVLLLTRKFVNSNTVKGPFITYVLPQMGGMSTNSYDLLRKGRVRTYMEIQSIDKVYLKLTSFTSHEVQS